MKTKAATLFTSMMLLVSIILGGCGSNMLSGSYEDESGAYTFEFETDGTCSLSQSGMLFNGTYELEEESYRVEMDGSGGYFDTTFEVTKANSGELSISGGVFNETLFDKQ